MTFSLLGFDPLTGDLGVAVQSKTPNTGAITPHGKANVGCVATQAFGNPRQALKALELMDQGMAMDEVLETLFQTDVSREVRQIGLINSAGATAVFTGSGINAYGGHAVSHQAENCVALGNLLADPSIPKAMTQAFISCDAKELEEKLLAGLHKGQEKGGEIRGKQSAAIMVFKENGGYQGNSDIRTDIRIFDHQHPIEELERCYQLHKLSYFESRNEDLIEMTQETQKFLKRVLVGEGFLNAMTAGWRESEVEGFHKFLNWSNCGAKIRTDALIDRHLLTALQKQHG